MVGPLFAIFLPVVIIAVFSFVTVVVWSDARRKEREAYYRSETVKKAAESPESGVTGMLQVLREQERIAIRRVRESVKVGGLGASAVGVAIMVFLRAVVRGTDGQHVYLVGLIPLLVGVALLAYAYLLAPKE